MAAAITACNDEDFDLKAPTPGDDAIRIGANVSTAVPTRGYIPSGTVTEGNFLLTYPYYYNSPNAFGIWRYRYHYGEVKFGYKGEEATGFVNAGTPEAPKYLVWSPTNMNTSSDDGIAVYPTSTGKAILVMDNFMYKPTISATDLTADTIVSLLPTAIAGKYDNPFKAGIFDYKNGTNDLLWGRTEEKTGVQQINFDLYHRMTRLILNVVVERNEQAEDVEEFSIDLSNARVTLTQVLLEPRSYLRLYGQLLFQDRESVSSVKPDISAPYQNIIMVLPPTEEDGETVYAKDANGYEYTWVSTEVDEATGNKIYTTPDFVFAPQTLRQGTDVRPRIEIRVPASDVNKGVNPGYGDQDTIVFSGNIPVTMKMDYDDGTPPALQTLNFDPGKVITLTTKMKPGEMELEFAPVTVEPWVYKGTFNPTAKQSGIYSPQDLYDLIEVYNRGDNFWLHKYGYLDPADNPTKWIFMLNSGNMEFEAIKIVGKMKQGQADPGPNPTPANYSFNFRTREQFYLMPDGTKISMGYADSNLFAIVNAETNVGVASTGEFTNLIEVYQRNYWQQFIYGSYNTDDETWVYRITEDITLDYNAIAASMLPRVEGEETFRFEFENGVSVTVEGKPGGSGTVTKEELYSIVSSRLEGVYSAADFTELTAAIRSGDEEAMAKYGTKTGTTWTFTLRRDITLDSADLQGMLHGVTTTNYQFDYNDFEVTFNQYDNTTATPTPEQLIMLLGLQKPVGLATPNEFAALIVTYNTTGANQADALSHFGYYLLTAGGTWDFFFTEAMTLDRAKIQGSMIPEDGRPAFKFNLNFKQIKFEGETGEGITGTGGAETLYNIVSTPAGTTDPDPVPAPRKRR